MASSGAFVSSSFAVVRTWEPKRGNPKNDELGPRTSTPYFSNPSPRPNLSLSLLQSCEEFASLTAMVHVAASTLVKKPPQAFMKSPLGKQANLNPKSSAAIKDANPLQAQKKKIEPHQRLFAYKGPKSLNPQPSNPQQGLLRAWHLLSGHLQAALDSQFVFLLWGGRV